MEALRDDRSNAFVFVARCFQTAVSIFLVLVPVLHYSLTYIVGFAYYGCEGEVDSRKLEADLENLQSLQADQATSL